MLPLARHAVPTRAGRATERSRRPSRRRRVMLRARTALTSAEELSRPWQALSRERFRSCNAETSSGTDRAGRGPSAARGPGWRQRIGPGRRRWRLDIVAVPAVDLALARSTGALDLLLHALSLRRRAQLAARRRSRRRALIASPRRATSSWLPRSRASRRHTLRSASGQGWPGRPGLPLRCRR